MKPEEFYKEYLKAEKWIDADYLINKLTIAEKIKLVEGLRFIKAWFGLDMREEFYLNCLVNCLKYKDKVEVSV